MRYYILLLLIFLLSCSNSKDHPIEAPTITGDFYAKALKQIEAEYKEKPSERLLRQKLYYFEKLNWPKESIDDLNIFLEKNGLDEMIVDLFLQYYLNNEEYSALTQMLDKWEFYHGLNEELSQYRVLANYRANGLKGAKELIKSYSQKFRSKTSFEFVVDQTLEIGDTLLLKSFLEELFSLDPSNDRIQKAYVPILLHEEDYKGAYQKLITVKSKVKNENKDYLMSLTLYGLDSVQQAKNRLKNYDEKRSRLQLSEWFRTERRFDSAIYFLDKIILKDSSRNLLLTKGEILEERGWFSSSYTIFNHLIASDTTDSIAINKAAIVARKIAYLRNLKEAERQIPIPELTPKRIVE